MSSSGTPNSEASMSSATKEILGRVRQLIPPMLERFHKGERDCCFLSLHSIWFIMSTFTVICLFYLLVGVEVGRVRYWG